VVTTAEVYQDIAFTDRGLIPIWEKVQARERLSFDDGLRIFQTEDFPAVGRMADHVKSRLWGDKVFFVLNRHINPTNVCVLTCSFCDFAKKKGDPGAYEMSMDQILGLLDDDIREAHMVGGHHPDWPFEHYENIVKTVHERFPNCQVKAFTASEIDYFGVAGRFHLRSLWHGSRLRAFSPCLEAVPRSSPAD